MKKYLLLSFVLMASFSQLMASHLVGGRIGYQFVSGNGYLVHLTLYRDCQGLTLGSTANVTCYSSSTSQVLNLTLTMIGTPVDVTPICPSSASFSSCNGGNYPGYQRADYQGTVTLSAASDWIIYYENCCRGGNITNLSNPTSDVMHIRCTLDNTTAPNNSAVFTQNPTFLIPNTMLSQLNYHSTDVDGDSLTYALVGAMGTSGAALAYNAPFSGTSPLQSTTGNVLDAATGIYSITPSAVQQGVVCVKVSEYRNGNLVGTVFTDMLVTTINIPTNALPTMSGINGGFLMSTSICPNQPLSFYMTTNDANAADSTFISYDGSIAAATFNTSYPTNHATGTFSWTPTPADVRPYPYIVTFTVHDNACSYYGMQTYAYLVYVNQCATDSVWPGDANADYGVDMYDVLALGVAYGDNGVTRPGANLSWTAQGCTDWTNSFASGINHKHADCNGDGTIDNMDTTAIFANYGNTHLRMGGTEGVGGLIVYADMPSSFDGNTYQSIPIRLDNVGSGINAIYGLSYTLSWPANMFDNTFTAVTTYNTLFANMAPNALVATRNSFANNHADLGMVKTNHLNIVPSGIVGYLSFQLLPNTSITSLAPSISNVQAIDSLGNIIPISALQNSSTVTWLGIDDVNAISNVQLFPNPANETVTVVANSNTSNQIKIEVQDMLGRVLVMQNVSVNKLQQGIQLNVKQLPAGIYQLVLNNGMSVTTQKLTVTH